MNGGNNYYTMKIIMCQLRPIPQYIITSALYWSFTSLQKNNFKYTS